MASSLTCSSLVYFLLHWCRNKICTSTPLLVVMVSEIGAIVSLIAFVIYLFGFFSIGFVNLISSHASSDDKLELEDKEDIVRAKDDSCNSRPCSTGIIDCFVISPP